MSASDDFIIVIPDELIGHAAVTRLGDVLTAAGGPAPAIITNRNFEEACFRSAHILACGNLTGNRVLERMYTLRYHMTDTFFPGQDGYFIKSISDPLGYGFNVLAAGASHTEALIQALGILAAHIEKQQGDLTRVHLHKFDYDLPAPPPAEEHAALIQADIDVWQNGWAASPFRGGQLQNYLWHYYLTDNPGWGRLIPPIFAGSLEPWLDQRRDHPESYHCFFNLHTFFHLWDAVEDSSLYTDDDRRDVVTLFGHLLEHLSNLFYLSPEVNPPHEPRQNHSTFIALDLAVGHDYMADRYDIHDFEPAQVAVKRIFEGQVDSYKPNDDAGVGYVWHVPLETLYYYLYKQDYRFLDEGPVADLCRLAVVTTDNMRSESSYGDTAGYSPFTPGQWSMHLWPLMVSAWRMKDPRHLWTLNWLGEGKKPSLNQVMGGLYAGVDFHDTHFSLPDVQPVPPEDLLGIYHMPLPEAALRWVTKRTAPPFQPNPEQTYFDKISLRPSFDPEDEYLLLEGVGTFCHGHEDTNAAIRLTWRNRAWLADGDYIRAAPKFHNAVTVLRDGEGVLESPGEGVVIPPLSTLAFQQESDQLGLLKIEAADYNGVDWQRHVFWGKTRYMVVMDRLSCKTTGDYHARCLWRLVGEVEQDGPDTRLHQEGVDFYIRNVDGAGHFLRRDDYEPGVWSAYPYSDGSLHELHQIKDRYLKPDDNLTWINLLTPFGDIRIERLADNLVKIIDGDQVSVLGIGPATLGAVSVEGPMFGITPEGDTLILEGVKRFGARNVEGVFTWTECNDRTVLAATDDPVGRHLKTVIAAHTGRPAMPGYRSCAYVEGGLNLDWMTEPLLTGPTTFDADEAMILCGGAGEAVALAPDDGRTLWRYTCDNAVTAIRLGSFRADESPITIIGTDESDLIVLNRNGEHQWTRRLKNISGRGERVADIAVADLFGDGRMSILAGTAGWYVNAFTETGEPLWAEWFRYHPITRVLAADVDGDGRAEVMVGNVYSTPLTVHNADGSFRWSTLDQVGSEGNATTPRRGIHLTQMVLADINGDGHHEIIYGTADGWIYAVMPQDGAECRRASVVGEVTGLALMPEGLVAATEFGVLYGFNRDCDPCWHVHVDEQISGLAVVGEYIFLIAPGGLLLQYDAEGHPVASHRFNRDIIQLQACMNGVVCMMTDGRCARVSVT